MSMGMTVMLLVFAMLVMVVVFIMVMAVIIMSVRRMVMRGIAVRFACTILEFGENELDAIDGRKNQRDPLMRRRCSIAQVPDQGFGRVGEMGEAG